MRHARALGYVLLLLMLVAAPRFLSSYHLSLLGRFLALAILALGLVLVWGWGGVLSLGQGVFFGIGAYVLAMHLKLAALGPGELPDFMQWSGLDHLPWWWSILHSTWLTVAAVAIVPGLAAGALAWLVFRRRVGGVYFALLTQALALAFSTLLVSQQPYTGGFNGLTDFSTLFGLSLIDPQFQKRLYWATVALLALVFVFLQWLLRSNFGKVLLAIRDGENRIRFLGYNPVPYKVAAFALGGVFAGMAGALFTLNIGVISPAMIGVMPSIEMVVWVAVGGRASLIGAVAGTLAVNFAKDWISSAMPDLWLFAIGALFVLIVMLLPNGLSGIGETIQNVRWRLSRRMAGAKKGKGLEEAAVCVAVKEGARITAETPDEA